MKLMIIPAGAFLVNTLLVWDEASKEAMVVDPGDKVAVEEIEDLVSKENLKVKFIVNTHEHPDHTAANSWAKLSFPKAQLLMHEEAAKNLNFWTESEVGELAGAEYSPQPDNFLKEGDEISLGDLKFTVFHTPGHSPGSIVLYSPQENVAIVGDLIFKGSIGRYDLPMSDFNLLKNSIIKLLGSLKPNTVLISGHGPKTTVREELENNPFIRELVR